MHSLGLVEKDSSITLPTVIRPWVMHMQSGVVLTFISWSRKPFCIQVWVLATCCWRCFRLQWLPCAGVPGTAAALQGRAPDWVLCLQHPPCSVTADQLSALLQFVLLGSGQHECSVIGEIYFCKERLFCSVLFCSAMTQAWGLGAQIGMIQPGEDVSVVRRVAEGACCSSTASHIKGKHF